MQSAREEERGREAEDNGDAQDERMGRQREISYIIMSKEDERG